MPYITIINVPGFLPDNMEDETRFATPREAWQSIVDEVESAWDYSTDDGAYLAVHTRLHAIDQSVSGTFQCPTPDFDGISDLGRAYSVVALEGVWYSFPGYDDDILSSADALQVWIDTQELILSESDSEQFYQFTHHSLMSPSENIAAIQQGADYMGIDLVALGYPLPTLMEV
jgi:hypothetical protein